uniref:Second triple gene block protein n=1 Tax=Erysiphe necator associated gora-like virus 1 TaxID=2744812 RepID=A0A8E4CZM3_9VIRU|nr:second triple gene block protein [Erysiphe necator associated gora-like virus 1]
MSKAVVGQRPNKYWPIAIVVCFVAFFFYLGFSHQKHDTTSGDQSHKFTNGGSIKDGNKKVVFNPNSNHAYNRGADDRTPSWLLLSVVFAIYVYLCYQFGVKGACGSDCVGNCVKGRSCFSDLLGDSR